LHEKWRDVKGYEGIYQISNLGRVKSLSRLDKRGYKRKEIILKETINPRGYKYVVLQDKKAKVTHRLVARSFLPNEENKKEVNHKNGNKQDNRLKNLEWVTHSENLKHACITGLKRIPKGDEHCNSKLTNQEAENIRMLYKMGNWTYKSLSKEFDVHESTVARVIKNKSYKNKGAIKDAIV
jgi:hypothetical protein